MGKNFLGKYRLLVPIGPESQKGVGNLVENLIKQLGDGLRRIGGDMEEARSRIGRDPLLEIVVDSARIGCE